MKLIVGDKTLTIRKWKGKDKRNFINSINKDNINENEVMSALVYDCIEEDVILSVDEFRYVLSRIRAYSLGEDINIEFLCSACEHIHPKTFKLEDIIRYTYTPLNEIKVSGNVIKLGPIKNKDLYIKRMSEDEIFDFLMRIESFNGDDTFTLESLTDQIDDLDIDVLTEIMDKFESCKFKIDDQNSVTCPECGHVDEFIFDELPGFFPDNWFAE